MINPVNENRYEIQNFVLKSIYFMHRILLVYWLPVIDSHFMTPDQEKEIPVVSLWKTFYKKNLELNLLPSLH